MLYTPRPHHLTKRINSCHCSDLCPTFFFQLFDTAPLDALSSPIAVVVALATLLVIPASYTEAIAFSIDEPTGRARFHPLIDRIYDQK